MFEWIMLKLGFSGLVAVVAVTGIIGVTVFHKYSVKYKDYQIKTLTAKVQSVTQDRDNLLKANRAYSVAVKSQNESIENLVRAGQEQARKIAQLKDEGERAKKSWDAFIGHLDASYGDGNRRDLYHNIYDDAKTKWDKGDSLPSEVE